jgi:TPR repeat protein
MAMKKVIAVFALFFGLVIAAHSADLRKGLEAYENGNFKRALNEFRQLAEQGLSLAKYNLGVMYDNGHGVNEDDEVAFRWFTAAAENGVSEAWFNLGEMYRSGEGVEADLSKAIKWLERAALSGDADAFYSLGLAFEAQNADESFSKALSWYLVGAEAGHALSQYGLANLYANGFGVDVSYLRAYMWATLSSAGGAPDARRLKSFLAKEMTLSELDVAQNAAASCLEMVYIDC